MISTDIIEHVNEYPTIHYFRNPRHTQSMIAYKILTEYSREYLYVIFHCGYVVVVPQVQGFS